MSDYKQASITQATAEKILEIKEELAKDGTPMSSPSIIGQAINDMHKKVVNK